MSVKLMKEFHPLPLFFLILPLSAWFLHDNIFRLRSETDQSLVGSNWVLAWVNALTTINENVEL